MSDLVCQPPFSPIVQLQEGLTHETNLCHGDEVLEILKEANIAPIQIDS